MNKKSIALAIFSLASLCIQAQQKDTLQGKTLQEVVISDSKFYLPKEKSGKIISVITASDLEKKSSESLAQVLNSVVGIELNGANSVVGKNLGYYVRGGKNNQVVVVIDGVAVSDASGINTEYDLRFLPVQQIERIEVMKGASSTLYGSGAATAVINITLKKNAKNNISGLAFSHIGSNNTVDNAKINGQDFNQGVSLQGNYKKLGFLGSFSSTETNGMSQLKASENQTYETDRFSRQSYLGKLSYTFSTKFSTDFLTHFDTFYNAYDNPFDNTSLADTNKNSSTNQQLRFGITPKYKYTKGEWVTQASVYKISRKYNEFNNWSLENEQSHYTARSVVFDSYNKYSVSNAITVLNGINFQYHDMAVTSPYATIVNQETKFSNLDNYINIIYTSLFGLNLNAGARLNYHNVYLSQWVYNVNPSYKLTNNVKIVSSYSTAFVAPSLYQLYSEYGNKNLTSEKNSTVEAGVETSFFNSKLTASAVGFWREQNNSIGFDATYHYTNIEGINHVKGLETDFKIKAFKNINISANYTFTQPDQDLTRLIPKHKINASIDIAMSNRWLMNASYQYTDKRLDTYYDGTLWTLVNTQLQAYQLFNFSTKYELIKNRMHIFASIHNILNKEYVENIGYNTLGRNFKIGTNISF